LQHVHSSTLATAQATKFDIDERISRLNQIADWRAELRSNLAYAVNNVWDGPPDLEALRAEVERFKLACKGVRA
jgi:hypothetical protein